MILEYNFIFEEDDEVICKEEGFLGIIMGWGFIKGVGAQYLVAHGDIAAWFYQDELESYDSKNSAEVIQLYVKDNYN